MAIGVCLSGTRGLLYREELLEFFGEQPSDFVKLIKYEISLLCLSSSF